MNSQIYEEKKFETRDFVLCSILMALTTIMTIIVQIPIAATHGYVNMGDTVVLFTGLYLGKKHGAIVGGFGSALADLITGYVVYAPITLVAKGLEGFVCGLIAEKIPTKKGKLLASIISGMIMVFGYFIGEIFLFGLKTSMLAVPANSLQACFGIISSLLIFSGVKKALKN